MYRGALPGFQSWLSSLDDQEWRFCASRWRRLADLVVVNDDEAAFGLLLTDLVVTVLERSGDELVDRFFATLAWSRRWEQMVMNQPSASDDQRRAAERRIALVSHGINTPDWELVRWVLGEFFAGASRPDFSSDYQLIEILVTGSTEHALAEGLIALVGDLLGSEIAAQVLESEDEWFTIDRDVESASPFQNWSADELEDLAKRIRALNPYRAHRPREFPSLLEGLTAEGCEMFVRRPSDNNSLNLATLRDGSYLPLPDHLKFDRDLDVLRIDGTVGNTILEVEIPRAVLSELVQIGYEEDEPIDSDHSHSPNDTVEAASPPLPEEAFADLLRAAFRYDWTVRVTGWVAYAVGPIRPIVLTGIRPDRDELLYFDRKYFEEISQGSRGWDGGLSLFGFGANLGHDTEQSILTAVKKSVSGKKKAITGLAQVCDKSEAVQLEAYVHLFTLIDQDPSEAEGFGLEVEEQRWQPALLANVETDPEPGVQPWALAYLARGGFRIPRNSWGRIRLPVRIFAEVINQGAQDFGFGDANCHLRVRAIAYLAPQQSK